MGLYAIDCLQCKKAFMWFSGNHLDQRCEDCKNPKTWWIVWSSESDESATIHRVKQLEKPICPYKQVEVIEKSIFDAQCERTKELVEEYNRLADLYDELAKS